MGTVNTFYRQSEDERGTTQTDRHIAAVQTVNADVAILATGFKK